MDLNQEPVSKTAESEIYPLTASPIWVNKLEADETNWHVNAGNTGLFIIVTEASSADDLAQQHFLPDQSSQVISGKQLKHSLAYAWGLYELAQWWKIHDFSTPDSPPHFSKLYGKTNASMHQFRKHLLGEDIYQEEAGTEDEHYYTLDLNKLVQNKTVMQKLERMAERCQKQDYKMTDSVPQRFLAETPPRL